MSLFKKMRAEFIDIIEWKDDSRDTLVWRFPRFQDEIKNGAKLTVRESQVAVFVNEGQIADLFTPGMYTLETQNLPILSTLKGWKYAFNSPFKAEVYFVSTKIFTDLKWGTKNPIMMRDPEFGAVRIRAFGNYTFRVQEPAAVIRAVAGTNGQFTIDGITEQIRNIIITRFTDTLGEAKIPVLDLAAKYEELSSAVENRIKPQFGDYGISIDKFLIENISLPEEVEKTLDTRSKMGIIGNMQQYTQFQMANAIPEAAANPGGMAGAGMGLGAGMAMGGQMAGVLGSAMFTGQQQPGVAPQAPGSLPPPIPGNIMYHIALNGQQQGPYTAQQIQSFIANGQFSATTLVWTAGMAGWVAASQVPDLAALFSVAPPPLPPPMS